MFSCSSILGSGSLSLLSLLSLLSRSLKMGASLLTEFSAPMAVLEITFAANRLMLMLPLLLLLPPKTTKHHARH